MRITGGQLSGRKLHTPAGGHSRPTTSRVREAVFNLIEARVDLEHIHVLDLFAGTGSLAFEALSRGADKATLVEKSRYILRYTRRNCQMLGLGDQCSIRRADAIRFVAQYKSDPFGLILADPPYQSSFVNGLPDQACRILAPDGLFVLEHDSSNKFDHHPALDTTRAYGRTLVSLFRV